MRFQTQVKIHAQLTPKTHYVLRLQTKTRKTFTAHVGSMQKERPPKSTVHLLHVLPWSSPSPNAVAVLRRSPGVNTGSLLKAESREREGISSAGFAAGGSPELLSCTTTAGKSLLPSGEELLFSSSESSTRPPERAGASLRLAPATDGSAAVAAAAAAGATSWPEKGLLTGELLLGGAPSASVTETTTNFVAKSLSVTGGLPQTSRSLLKHAKSRGCRDGSCNRWNSASSVGSNSSTEHKNSSGSAARA